MLKTIIESNKQRNSKVHEENQYLNLIEDILKNGEYIEGRNGRVKGGYGAAMHFDLRNNTIPILTTKKVAWKTCFKELLWFMRGQTNNNILIDEKVNIWTKNAEDYKEKHGEKIDSGEMGPIYGHQWRNFNGTFHYKNHESINSVEHYEKGVDQLQQVISMLKDPKEKYSRRIILTAWNPCQLEQMALPPCHVFVQFQVNQSDELITSLYQRSGDVGLGVPFNIASYSFLTYILAKHCDLKVGEFNYYLGNVHIYDDHLETLEKQIQKEPFEFPKVEILRKYENIESYHLEDVQINNYVHHEKISMEMRK